MTNEVETRQCRRCHEDYTPEYYEVLDLHLLKGDGYCQGCAKEVYEEELAREKAVKTVEIARVRRERRENSGIPPKFMNQDFSTFEKGWQDKALKICQEYAENFPIDMRPKGYKSLYLWSSETWGTGKTHLACAVVHRILDRWQGETNKGCPRIVFVSEPDLFRQIQATYSFTYEEKQLRESEDDIIKRIIYADLVVLDDVGKEPRRDMHFVRSKLFGIINGRYDQNLPIVLTANLEPAKLKTHLDEPPTEASFNRLLEMTKKKSIRMDGDSYRRR